MRKQLRYKYNKLTSIQTAILFINFFHFSIIIFKIYSFKPEYEDLFVRWRIQKVIFESLWENDYRLRIVTIMNLKPFFKLFWYWITF